MRDRVQSQVETAIINCKHQAGQVWLSLGTCLYWRLETNWLDNFKLLTEVNDLLGAKYSNKQKLWTPCKPVIIYIASLGYHNNQERGQSGKQKRKKAVRAVWARTFFYLCQDFLRLKAAKQQI